MAWFKKKPDPISDRARTLSGEIAQLELEIQRLSARMESNPPSQPPPRVGTTVLPGGAAVSLGVAPSVPPQPTPPASHEPIFEEVGPGRLKGRAEGPSTSELYNELGVRKYDLPALLERLRNHFRGPSTTNPKLVSYLAAGGIQGLRPLRYEKRVARNRFIVFVGMLFLALLGILLVFARQHR